jgi:REP element-mobilizing transposase RayT
MTYDPRIHHRRSIRLAGYDYSLPGAYFVTLNTQEQVCIFGEVVDDEVRLSSIGEIVRRCWLDLPNHFLIDLDVWVVMPNHLHGIILLRGKGEASGDSGDALDSYPPPDASPLRPYGTGANSLGAIIQNFKSISTRKINQVQGTPGGRVWQRNYYEHVVRDDADLERIRQYIDDNPLRWGL